MRADDAEDMRREVNRLRAQVIRLSVQVAELQRLVSRLLAEND